MINIDNVKKLIEMAKKEKADFFDLLDFDTFLEKINNITDIQVSYVYDLDEFCTALLDVVLFDCITTESSHKQQQSLLQYAKDNNFIDKDNNLSYEENAYIICINLLL